MAREEALRAEGIRKIFPSAEGELEILKGVDLVVRSGEAVAIVGPSGVGKTTLLHILGGLDRPTKGRVLHFGEDLSGLSDEALSAYRNRYLGFVFQFHYLLPEFDTLENVMLPGLLAGVPRREVRRRAEEWLDRLGLSGRIHHRLTQLSGGERQRAALARALLLRPRILFADEPTGNLDAENAREVADLLLQLNRKYDTTLVVVTHNLELAERMDRVLRLENGRLREVSS
ncbi:ABC transporter ATP-binding protein [Thermosulfurimonas sp. F29]|uniref:ABC transporter ATP-binding protein n=1 Tax=Thermosulfurimonas sp. F29 TaxID=2867247 RepID=UPI001C83D00E|nr:ABC transporter ATP-binding protein [Thermosulfurimonas sp. F29]MBX6422157.1 ABC transporter ATP-binding protein [Thermosulfurimonas sp. F29]